MEKLVVTRHDALIDYLLEMGMIDDNTTILSHVNVEDVRGRHVIGVLPLSLASVADSVTEIPLSLTPEDRGKELSLDRVREIAGDPVRYVVRKVELNEY